MELIARHASHLPPVDDLIIKRVNKFCCLNWHLNMAIRTGHNNDCFEHAIAHNHNKCLFTLLRYYASSQYYPNLMVLSYLCAYYDNLEALKYTFANYDSIVGVNAFNNLIDQAMWGSSFKCLIFCCEKGAHMWDIYDVYVKVTKPIFYLDAVVFRNKNYIPNINKYMQFNGYGKIRL